MFSWIQNHILIELTRHKTRRYSQLRPRDIEGNLFMYHLKGLIKEGLVEKHEREYQLSVKGLQFVATLSLTSGKTRKQPKILSAIVYKNEAGEFLFSRWHRQPNIELISFPHGTVHYGESVWDAAKRELREKAGCVADLHHLGEVYIRSLRGDEVDRHMLVHLFAATNIQPGSSSDLRPEVSEPFWAPYASLNPVDFVPGFYEIIELYNKQPQGGIFAEITVSTG